jgi:hypothetical protein
VTSLANDPGLSAHIEVARAFLACLADQNFDGLSSAFADDVHLRALLPAEMREWQGADEVKATFMRWFGKTQEFELVAADVDAVGSRLHVWWRARLRAERLGEGWFVAEQHAYVDTDDESRINRVSLVCSGYVAE